MQVTNVMKYCRLTTGGQEHKIPNKSTGTKNKIKKKIMSKEQS